ncbi:uncharacterized protein BDV17DRAFT_160576 [Aspergillus undulatus]|uniref:uncharacterized protein n=1 Tax=Aspergillus undulatus TaxID=1810928 RepID=UPI003CCE2726
MALPALPDSSSSPFTSSPSSLLTCLPISFSSLFLSCAGIHRRCKNRSRKGRHNDSPNSTTNSEKDRCSHIPATTCICTCTYASPTRISTNPTSAETSVETSAEAEKDLNPESPIQNKNTNTNPNPNPNTISITQTTSIRIVDSDISTRTSSDYDSTISRDAESDSDSDGYSVSDYECHCENVAEQGHVYENEDEDKQCLSFSNRPLPPLPTSRKTAEIKMRLIEETIPEEDEDEYLAQQQLEKQEKEKEQREKKHKRTTSRRKSMIELLNLSSPTSAGTSAGSRPGLSVSFSHLHFRFPLPIAWTQDGGSSTSSSAEKENGSNTFEKRRPMSMSALGSGSGFGQTSDFALATTSTSRESDLGIGSRADFLEGFQFQTLPKALISPRQQSTISESAPSPIVPISSPGKTISTSSSKSLSTPSKSTPSPRTKKERRMGTVLFPPSPLAMLSRSNIDIAVRDGHGEVDGNTITGKSQSLFC